MSVDVFSRDDSTGRKGILYFETAHAVDLKSKAGCPVELGVPVCIMESEFRFVLHHEIMWKGSDVEFAVPMVVNTQAKFPDLRSASSDRGIEALTTAKTFST